MHPRVGGTFQDLAARVSCAAIGAVWGGFAYAAGVGNPYFMAVFAAIYMIPMLYRFTQSSHPRSGVVGCISFTVVSLSAYTSGGHPSIITIAWTRGLAFVVGVVAALIVNWVLWPFIARHELRKSLSAMMLHSAILYRGVIAKYVYYSEGDGPGPEDIARSEMLEGRLREGFVRMRQLMELTRHEMRLRAPFDPLPYSALISACESFFEHLVQVRQSALYFQTIHGCFRPSNCRFSYRSAAGRRGCYTPKSLRPRLRLESRQTSTEISAQRCSCEAEAARSNGDSRGRASTKSGGRGEKSQGTEREEMGRCVSVRLFRCLDRHCGEPAGIAEIY